VGTCVAGQGDFVRDGLGVCDASLCGLDLLQISNRPALRSKKSVDHVGLIPFVDRLETIETHIRAWETDPSFIFSAYSYQHEPQHKQEPA
jgi:hypothetical protein